MGDNADTPATTNERFGAKLHLVWHNTTWLDNETTKIYLEKTFGGILGLFKPKRLLVWDAFKAHTSEATKKVLKALKLHSSVIPGGCTRFIQWMLDGVHETTSAGNPKPPPPELKLEWMLESRYDGVTKDNEGNGIPNGLYELTKTREATEAQELAEILSGFEIEAPDEDDTGHVSDVEVVDDDSAVTDDEDSGPEDENHNLSDDSDF